MKITVLTLTGTQAKIIIEDTNPYFINAIRRTLLVEIPKLAIENVTVYDNTSSLFDEIISHRLSLIPLPTHSDLLEFKEKCKCLGEGCPTCTVHYTLSKEGACTVYSKDLKSEDTMWEIKDGEIPIATLLEGQRLILEAEANLGIGKSHVKWQTVSGLAYKYYPEITIKKTCDLCGDCITACPRGILKIKKDQVVTENITDCSLCQSCMETCGKKAIRVMGKPDKIILQYETDGSLTAKMVLIKALQILAGKFSELEKEIKEIK